MRIPIDPTTVAANFAQFRDNGSFQESAQLFASGRPILEMLQAMAMNGGVLRAFSGFDSVYPHGRLERPLVEKVILRVSQLHDCQFCAGSHQDIMHSLGIDGSLQPGGLTARERLAIQYAEQITRDSNRVGDELFAELQAAMSDAEIVELTFVTGLITMLNRFNNALGVRYHGELRAVEKVS